MAISEVVESEKTTYRVRVFLRSKKPGIPPVQYQQSKIPSLDAAKKTEKLLVKKAHLELATRESRGASWEVLLESWHDSMMNDSRFFIVRQKQTQEELYNFIRAETHEWNRLCASALNSGDIRQVLDSYRARGKSWSRVKALKSGISAVLQWAIDTHRLPRDFRNPVIGISFGKNKTERTKTVLNLNQIREFLTAARDNKHPYQHVWEMAVLTGARSGELFALKWENVDLESRLINISTSFSSRINAIKSTKSGSWREIPINSDLERVLLELRPKTNASGFVLPRIRSWERGDAARELRKFLIGIGLPEIRFHDLRASFATTMLRNGTAPITVMKICGWQDLKTMQYYIRLGSLEVKGATDGLQLLPETNKVVALKIASNLPGH